MIEDSRFGGQSAFVTGSARGIGRAVAEAFVAAGANVAIADLDETAALAAASEIQGVGAGQVLGLRCDVCNKDSVTAAIARSADEFGSLDVVVNNAGIAAVSDVVDMPEEEWDRIMAVNVKGVFLCTQAALNIMLPAGRGTIVNVASQAGKHGIPRMAHYCASKAAVLNFSRSVALEAAPHVRVNCVCPGIAGERDAGTEMVEHEIRLEMDLTGASRETIVEKWRSSIPLGRFQPTAKVAVAVLFLASDDASEITGEALHVDGGMVMD